MTRNFIFLVCFSISFFQMQSQEFFMTKKGHLQIITNIDNQTVTIESHNLSIYLNYTTKEMKGVLDLRSLAPEIPELNAYIKAIEEPLLVHFRGVIPAEDFMSHPHNALTFNWLVKVSFQNKKFEIILRSTLDHSEEGYLFSCRLTSFGNIEAEKLGLNKLIPNIDDNLSIEIVQTILRDY